MFCGCCSSASEHNMSECIWVEAAGSQTCTASLHDMWRHKFCCRYALLVCSCGRLVCRCAVRGYLRAHQWQSC